MSFIFSINVRAHGWKVSNAIDKAMEDLPDYPTLEYGFGQILIDHHKNMEEGRKEMIAQAVTMIQATKEPRPKRAKKKGRA